MNRERKWDDVYSPLDGTVKFALKTVSDYGRRLYIEYDSCILLFAHLEELYVKAGDVITAGQLIGKMGTTGFGGDIHLHISQFNKRAKKLTAEFTTDPTFTLKMAPYYVTNTKVSNPYKSKYHNPKLTFHEGIDFSGNKGNLIKGWETIKIDPLYQDYLIRSKHPEYFT